MSQRGLGTLIFNILMAECGAIESDRDQFMRWFIEGPGIEFRIGGKLGFGGKFWKNSDRYYVSCYPEDMKAKQKKIITKVNALLEGVDW